MNIDKEDILKCLNDYKEILLSNEIIDFRNSHDYDKGKEVEQLLKVFEKDYTVIDQKDLDCMEPE